MSEEPARIVIDGIEHPVESGRNLLEVALELGYDLPYFCWHPALGAVGACRQCAVTQYADADDQSGRVVMACMTPCNDGTRVSLQDLQAVQMRSGVIEFLMTNHPHDCPVCEEGGNCHLQDMTVMTGHSYRRYRHSKRTHRNQDLGPFVSHEMNRCIACYRCVRYYRDYAGGDDLNVFGAHHHVYFGRAEDGTLESKFSGNLVEVCPTGVFTDKPYAETYTRKWDLQQAPGICAHCSVGCNLMPGERYGRIKRIENRYNHAINGYFLCDRGRYGHGYNNDPRRDTQALLRTPDGDHRLTPQQALEQLAARLENGTNLGIGSPRASTESNFALQTLLGADRVFRGETALEARLADQAVSILQEAPIDIADVPDLEAADMALVLGEDIGNTAPRLELALRQMTRNAGKERARQAHVPLWQDQSVRLVAQDTRSPLFLATPVATELDSLAAAKWRGTPDGIARLGFAVAHALNINAPQPAELDPGLQALAGRIATSMRLCDRAALVSGTGCLSSAVLDATAAIAWAYHTATGKRLALQLVQQAANSVGSSLLGGQSLDDVCELARRQRIDTLVVLENDLSRQLSQKRLQQLLSQVDYLVTLDHLPASDARVNLHLPVATVFEGDGTYVNLTGRAQRNVQTYAPEGDQRESWCWLQHTGRLLGRDLGLTLGEIQQACADQHPSLAGIAETAPDADFLVGGTRIPRQPHRYSGRTAMQAHRDIHEHQPPADPDGPFAFSMEGASALKPKPSSSLPLIWSPGWNSPQAINKFQAEIAGPLRGGDPGVMLLQASEDSPPQEFAEPPAVPQEAVTVPLVHVFGSEELSRRSPAVEQRGVPAAYLALNPATARAHRLQEGTKVQASIAGQQVELPLQLRDDLAPLAIGLPVGAPEIVPALFGQSVTLSAPQAEA